MDNNEPGLPPEKPSAPKISLTAYEPVDLLLFDEDSGDYHLEKEDASGSRKEVIEMKLVLIVDTIKRQELIFCNGSLRKFRELFYSDEFRKFLNAVRVISQRENNRPSDLLTKFESCLVACNCSLYATESVLDNTEGLILASKIDDQDKKAFIDKLSALRKKYQEIRKCATAGDL